MAKQPRKPASRKARAKLPEWVMPFVERTISSCHLDGKERLSGYSYRLLKPNPNDEDTNHWLLQIAPMIVELEDGPEDGEHTFDPVDVDLLGLSKCMSEIEYFAYDSDYSGAPCFLVDGKENNEEVRVVLRLWPFDDDEPGMFFNTVDFTFCEA